MDFGAIHYEEVLPEMAWQGTHLKTHFKLQLTYF